MNEMPTAEEERIYTSLHYHCTAKSGRRSDAEDYLLDFNVKIVGESILDERPDIHLGDLEATLIRTSNAGNEGFPFFEVLDHSQELSDLGGALFESGCADFVDPIQQAFPDAFPHDDILYIRGQTVQPFARGQRVGISALHRFMTDWDRGCSLIAINPGPMQFFPGVQQSDAWNDLQLGAFPQDRSEACTRLENHYRGLGFKTVDDLPYMFLCPARRQAPLEELALEDSLTLDLSGLE